MNRRDNLLVLLTIGATPLSGFAQQLGKVWRIGYPDLASRQSAKYSPRWKNPSAQATRTMASSN